MAQELEYRVISSGAHKKFEEEVNQALAEGWQLYGPLAFTGSNEARVFAQAMVRGKETPSAYEDRGLLVFG